MMQISLKELWGLPISLEQHGKVNSPLSHMLFFQSKLPLQIAVCPMVVKKPHFFLFRARDKLVIAKCTQFQL